MPVVANETSVKDQNRTANSADPEEAANYEPSQQDLHCLKRYVV